MNNSFLVGTLVGGVAILIVVMLGGATLSTLGQYRREKRGGGVSNFVHNQLGLLVGIDVMAILAMIVALGVINSNQTNRPPTQTQPTPEAVRLCESEIHDFDVTTNGREATFTTTMPPGKQWAFDFGDGDHTPVWFSKTAEPYTVTHTYVSTGTFRAQFLQFNPEKDCSWRTPKDVVIP